VYAVSGNYYTLPSRKYGVTLRRRSIIFITSGNRSSATM